MAKTAITEVLPLKIRYREEIVPLLAKEFSYRNPMQVPRIEKVVINLVINALDATDGKGPVVVEYGGGDIPFIRITDNGCGMTPEFILNDLFAPFKTTKSKGLGIGLFQSRQIVEAHMGKIEVSSEPGRGSIFTVWLPLMGSDTEL